MWPSLKPSQRVAVAAAIAPQSSAAALNSGWISMAVFHRLMAVIATGALGMAATVDAKFQQATDANGTGAKDVPTSAIAQVTKAGTDGSNTQQILQLKGSELDINNGFSFVQLVVTPGVDGQPGLGDRPGLRPALRAGVGLQRRQRHPGRQLSRWRCVSSRRPRVGWSAWTRPRPTCAWTSMTTTT